MEILKVETESSFFGLRQRVRFLVGASSLDGQPEDYWMYATEHNIRYMAQQLNKAHQDLSKLRREQRERAPRQLIITLKELSATVADAVERSVSAHPALRVLLDKAGGFASGGIVKAPAKPGLVGEHTEPCPYTVKDARVHLSEADVAAASVLKARVTTTEGHKAFVGGFGLGVEPTQVQVDITLLDESVEPSDVARQIREAAEKAVRDVDPGTLARCASRFEDKPLPEPLPNTSLDPVQPVEGISANREDRLSPND